MLKVTAVFLVSLLVVQGLQIPFEYKTVKANAVSQNGNNENVVDKHGLLVGTVSVGTPLQDVNVVFDTNSGILWVPSSECTCAEECSYKSVCYDICNSHCCSAPKPEPENPDKPDPETPDVPNPENPKKFDEGAKGGFCTNKNAFNAEKSQSFQATKKTLFEELNGVNVTVTIGLDRFRLGPHHRAGLNAQRIQFGTVKDFPVGYENLPFDGVFGLARSAPTGLKTPIKQLLDQNSQTEFVTIYTTKNYRKSTSKGIITVGQINTDLCKYNPSNLVPLVNRVDWTFRVFSVIFNQTRQSDLRWTATIDLNSPYLTIPQTIYDSIIRRVGVVHKDPETGDLIVNYQSAIQAVAGSSISIGKANWEVESRNLVSKISDQQAILYLKPSTGTQWVLGRPFLNNRCAFLDYTGRIGFGAVIDYDE